MEEGSESYVWAGNSQPMTECPGCSKLRREVEDLKTNWMSPRQREDDNVYCRSTYISDRKQTEIDLLLLEARQKADRFQQAYDKTLQENYELRAQITELKKQFDERLNVLKEQNSVYVADFQLERTDRERSQSRLIEVEEQLAAASNRIAELEDDKRRLLTSVTTTRHQDPVVPVHREFIAEPTAQYSEPHLPSYSSVYGPRITHHQRQSARAFGRGYDVCDTSSDSTHNTYVQ